MRGVKRRSSSASPALIESTHWTPIRSRDSKNRSTKPVEAHHDQARHGINPDEVEEAVFSESILDTGVSSVPGIAEDALGELLRNREELEEMACSLHGGGRGQGLPITKGGVPMHGVESTSC